MKKITAKSIMAFLILFLTAGTLSAQKKSIEKLQKELGFELSKTNKIFYEATGLVKCASYEHNKKLRQEGKLSSDEDFEKMISRAIAKDKLAANNGKMATIYTIPVVVHVYHKGEAIGTGTNISDAIINSQITVLNQDFRRMTGTPGHNTNAVGADTEIQFCLAKKDPNGNVTTGITRTQGISGSYTDTAFNIVKPNTQWDPTKYLNIWVADLGAQLLGYAQFPHANGVISGMSGGYAGGNANTDGVVMGPNFFGSSDITTVNGSAPYDKGRTTTHEVGHWLGLKHITGDSNCGDDNCADTPTQGAQTGQGTACNPTTSCSSTDMIENYMDYSNDTCMNIFTADQTARMRAILNPANNIVNRGTLVQAGLTHTLCSSTPDYTVTANNSPVSACAGSNAVFNFTFGVSNGYNTNTTLSATAGVPAGANVVFSPTAMSAAGAFTMTVNNLTAPGNHTITITATGTTTKTVDVTLNVVAGAPAVPTLTNPTDNLLGTAIPTNLVWAAAANASTYTVETATDAGFTANTTSNSVATTNYSITGLTQGTQYFWRVKAVNGCGESAYSSVFNFTTATISCNTDSNNTSVAIPNATVNGTEAAPGISTIAVSNNVTITDVNVTVNITYGYVEDLRLVLTSPSGTTIELVKNLASNSGANFTNTVFDDAGTTAITATTPANAPFTATYSPENPLSAVNGQTSIGNWTLSVYDNWTDDSGTINSWSIEICGSPILGIEDIKFAESVNVYPNPNNGQFFISFLSINNQPIKLTLIDMRGRFVSEQTFENNTNVFNQEVHFNDLAKAVYILKIQAGNNETFKRLVIK